MRIILSLLLLASISVGNAFEIELEELSYCDTSSEELINCNPAQYFSHYGRYSPNISCSSLEKIKFYAGGTGVALQVTGAYMACTGVGIGGSALLTVAGALISTVSFAADSIPCEVGKPLDTNIEELVEIKICNKLKRMGIDCEVPSESIDINYSSWICSMPASFSLEY